MNVTESNGYRPKDRGKDHIARIGLLDLSLARFALLSSVTFFDYRIVTSRAILGAVLYLIAMMGLGAAAAYAQDNYEIQVYPYETVEPGHTMVELHSNFTIDGTKTVQDGVLPSNHAQHETIEITHGFNDWFEVGFYIFTYERSGYGVQWVGDHIRPRVRIPNKWNWPVGLSLSQEIGYQRRKFSVDTWTWEIRPIADKQIGRWYFSLNPTLERSFH